MTATKKIPTEDMRQHALAQFNRMGFPKPMSEEYRNVPIARALSTHFSDEQYVKKTASTYTDIAPFLLTEVSKNQLVFINGKFDKALSSWNPEEKWNISTLQEAMVSHPGIVAAHFEKHKDEQDPFALLNTAVWQDGAFVHVPKNTMVKEPLIIYYLHDAKQEKVATHTRLSVVIEAGSQLHIIEKTDSLGTHPVFSTLHEDIDVQEGATLNYCKIQNDKGLLYKVSNTYINQSNASQITTHTITLSGELIRNNLNVKIDGENCQSYLYGLYLAQNKTLIDNHTVVDHKKPNSNSNELYKGIIGDHAHSIFNGKIYVQSIAQQTNAFQSNRNILTSDTSTIHAKPQLEIWADDVKCSHGCTSGQLDHEALFYLRSRGISKSDAQAMLLHAFASEIFTSIDHESLKKTIEKMTSKHLSKDFRP